MKKRYLDFRADVLQIITEDELGHFSHEEVPFDLSKPFSIQEMKDRVRQSLTDAALQYITWFDPKFTLIPMSLFSENELETYYQLNFGSLSSDETILFEKIHSLQMVVIFAVPNWLKEWTTSTLLQQVIHSHITFLLQKQFAENQTNSTYLLLFNHNFVLSVKQQNQLQICLPVEYQTASDVLYFLLSNHQKMNISKVNTLQAFLLSTHFDQEEFEGLWKQFKDFNEFETDYFHQAAYQKSILCASSVVS